jgi:hypothetical protein
LSSFTAAVVSTLLLKSQDCKPVIRANSPIPNVSFFIAVSMVLPFYKYTTERSLVNKKASIDLEAFLF